MLPPLEVYCKGYGNRTACCDVADGKVSLMNIELSKIAMNKE
jgi:hypothetical protein